MGLNPSSSASKWCQGKGLEIGGGAHNPFYLDTLNVDVQDDQYDMYKTEQIRNCGSFMPVDIIASGDNIPVDDNSQDFVVSSHVLEHFHNPVKALLEWYRVVRPGGIIFMIVPHMERTFDKGRPRTLLFHLLEDYNYNTNFGHGTSEGHDHVWITEDIVELVVYMRDKMGVAWDIVEVQDTDDKVGNGFSVVLRKRELNP